ncbi:MAG TPA: ABC-F family ATP-binding cassette domain-containing protein [Methylomirabilota bacterium]|jgi:ATP-binding cassette subfamily F protein 3|nr:ABC-F family ATP-binding cassette domain-containing protein [Methylomirabilota bacterium]
MIALDAISKGFGGRPLLREASWRIGRGERIGLVGPNGAGKTTLCRILAGVEPPDAGRVHRDTGVSVGYLPQEVGGLAAGTVLAEALSGFEDVWRLEAELERLADLMADPAASEAVTERYGEIQHRFEALGGYRLEAQAKVILGGLGFATDDVHRPLAEFSGGWRMRAALARLLLLAPDLLLLDEPTNHLDIESLQWLEGFLSSYEGSVVVVSHDRYFLNRMVTSIAEVTEGGVTLYEGDYDHFLVEREARQALLEARARNQAKRVAEIERFVERFRYQATKARQVQSRVKMLDKLERIEVARAARRIRFTFPQPPRTGRLVGRLVGIHKAYGTTVVYAGADFEVERGQRVALVGVNGAGKSTLLKILAGVLPIDGGERTLGTHVGVHYYAQHQLDALEPSRTVLEELEQADPSASLERLRTILGSFLFSGDDVDKRVAVLSGGEKARVALAKMLVRPAALLCLDEPTNHLDLASKEVLEDALANFTGTIVFISHDRYFINRMASHVVEVEHGRLHVHIGSYDDYLARKASGAAPAPATPAKAAPGKAAPLPTRPAPPPRRPGPHPKDPSSTPPSATPKVGKALSREIKALQARLAAVETQIAELERRLEEIALALADPDLYRDGDRARVISQQRKDAEQQVAWLMKEWEDLSLSLAAVERP